MMDPSLEMMQDEMFDMDIQKDTSDFLSDSWSASPDDLLDSFFSINGDFLKELDDSETIHFNEIPPVLPTPAVLLAAPIVTARVSPVSSVEPDFPGFLETAPDNVDLVHDVSQYVNYANTEPTAESSSSSDSGLSSDNMELDASPDYEAFSPAMSSPGPSISERGGKNSPARSVVSIPPVAPTPIPLITPNNTVETAVTVASPPPKPRTTNNTKLVNGSVTNKRNASEMFTIGKKDGIPPNQKEVKIYKMSPATAQQMQASSVSNSGSTNKKVTIQVKNTQGKLQHSAGTFVINKNNGNFSGVRKLVRVQNPSNPRSILLPVSFQDVKDFRTIKIINASNLNNKSAGIKLAAANLLHQSKQGLVQKNVLISKEQLIDDSMSEHTSDAESYVFEDVMMPSSHSADVDINDSGHQSDDSSDSSDTPTHHHQSSSYPKLMLTNEERRLLDKEGISLPGNYPLTKHEERELKRIRRKIRNKISAQDSRKRKKEYVDGLEERVKQCTDENQTLIKRLKLLQSQHNNLTGQVKKLQAMLSKGTTNKTTQPATCLMVLLISLALVAVPNLKLGQNAKDTELADALQEGLLANRRNLLFDTNEQLGDVLVDEEMNLDDILAYSQEINEHDYAADVDGSAASIVAGVSSAKRTKSFIEFDVDDRVWRSPPPPCTSSAGDSKDFFGKAATYQQYLKNEQAAAAASHAELLAIGGIKQKIQSKSSPGIYEINLENIAMFAGNTPDHQVAGLSVGTILQQQHKLNDSKIAIGERKILMKGA